MPVVQYFGDSGETQSALTAYKKARDNMYDDIALTIKSASIQIIKNHFRKRSIQLDIPQLGVLEEFENPDLLLEIKSACGNIHFYYEQSNNANIYFSRCFTTTSIEESRLNAIIARLSQKTMKEIYHCSSLPQENIG